MQLICYLSNISVLITKNGVFKIQWYVLINNIDNIDNSESCVLITQNSEKSARNQTNGANQQKAF